MNSTDEIIRNIDINRNANRRVCFPFPPPLAFNSSRLDIRYHPYSTPNTSKSSSSSVHNASLQSDYCQPLTSSPCSSSTEESFLRAPERCHPTSDEPTYLHCQENYPPVFYQSNYNSANTTGESFSYSGQWESEGSIRSVCVLSEMYNSYYQYPSFAEYPYVPNYGLVSYDSSYLLPSDYPNTHP